MNDKIAKLWHWHENLQGVLNDVREAQGLLTRAMKESDNEKAKSMLNNLSALIEIINDNLNFSADFLNSIKDKKQGDKMFNEQDYKDFKAEMYANSDDTLKNLGEIAKMLLTLNRCADLSDEQMRYLEHLINDSEEMAHKYDNFCDEIEHKN